VTLAIAAISSVAAAILVSKIWSGGTLWATAMTPVIVALVKEALERPAQKIDVGVSKISTVRRADPDALVVEDVEPGPEPNEVSVYSTRGAGHKWKIAALTGLLAAVVAIAALTLPELVAGRSIFGGGDRTTIFRGHTPKAKTTTQETQTQTVTETQPTDTVTQTVPSNTQTTPTVTETTPAQTQTAPTTTTPPSGGATTPTTPTTTPAP
jgi:hypothetical protein